MKAPSILIAGAGAVGTVLATFWAAGGRPVRLYARPRDLASFEVVPELRLEPADPRRRTLVAPRPELVTTLDLSATSALVIGVKAPALDSLMASLPAVVPAACTLVCTLNGVDALRRLRQRFPGARVVALSVMFNAQRLGPLQARLTTRAEVIVGSRDAALVSGLRSPGLSVKTAEGDAAAWGKLLINLANAICALTHATFKDLLLDADLRHVYAAVLDEASEVLAAARIRVQLPVAVPLRLYRELLLTGGPLPWWFARWRNGLREGAFPSMVADVAAGRATEVEQLYGEIARLGRQVGVSTPVNAQLAAWIATAPHPMVHQTPPELRRRCGLTSTVD